MPGQRTWALLAADHCPLCQRCSSRRRLPHDERSLRFEGCREPGPISCFQCAKTGPQDWQNSGRGGHGWPGCLYSHYAGSVRCLAGPLAGPLAGLLARLSSAGLASTSFRPGVTSVAASPTLSRTDFGACFIRLQKRGDCLTACLPGCSMRRPLLVAVVRCRPLAGAGTPGAWHQRRAVCRDVLSVLPSLLIRDAPAQVEMWNCAGATCPLGASRDAAPAEAVLYRTDARHAVASPARAARRVKEACGPDRRPAGSAALDASD